MGVALTRSTSSILWELRGAWATGKRVALTLDGYPRVEGFVTRVAGTGAFVKIGGLHVPTDFILAVHWPSALGDGTWLEEKRPFWTRSRLKVPQAERLPGL